MRLMLVGFVAVMTLAACGRSSPSPAVSNSVAPLRPTVASRPPSTAMSTATASPAQVARCGRQGDTAFHGVLEVRPPGWSAIGELVALPHFPNTFGEVYGRAGAAVPPNEGPGRIVLYETMPGNDVYLKSRIERSLSNQGKPTAVSLCGEATNVWVDVATGELVVGWVDRDKTDVLVANTADLTIEELVDSAESVSDCCG
jgi:hypothetical protein